MIKIDSKKKYVYVLIVIGIIVLCFISGSLVKSKERETKMKLSMPIDSIKKVEVYYNINEKSKYEHTNKEEIKQFVSFFEDKKYAIGTETDKDVFLATIAYTDAEGQEIVITIVNELIVVSEVDGNTKYYEYQGMPERFHDFYVNLLGE